MFRCNKSGHRGKLRWYRAIATLKANFGVTSEVARVAFGQAWRMTGESARAYAARLLRLSSSIADFRESELRSAFVMRCANDHHRAAMSAMTDFNAMVLCLHTQEEQDALRALKSLIFQTTNKLSNWQRISRLLLDLATDVGLLGHVCPNWR